MKYQLLGHSGIMISELTLGSATFGGTPPVGGVTLEQTRDLVHLALDAGVNSFDTANNYGGGDGETFLGETLRGVRDRVVVTSKVGQKSVTESTNAACHANILLSSATPA